MSSIEPTVPIARATRRGERGSERARALRFGAFVAVCLGGAGSFKLYRGSSPGVASALLAVASAMLVYSIVHPAGALALRRGWMRTGEALGRVNAGILLSILYFAVVTPIGLVFRVFSRRSRVRGESPFVARNEQRNAKHFEHPY